MEKQKHQRLSRQQRHLLLNARDGAFFRKHRRPDDVECYRLLTADHRPLLNTTAIMIDRLQKRGYLQYSAGKVILSDRVRIGAAGRIYLQKKPVRIYKAIVLNDYDGTPYAEWVKQQKKTIETRMNRMFSYRGDIVICCGKTNSVGSNAGKALCIVNLYDAAPMEPCDATAAMIAWHPKLKAHFLKDWRYFSREFQFNECYVSGTYQGIFEIAIPDDVDIISTHLKYPTQ